MIKQLKNTIKYKFLNILYSKKKKILKKIENRKNINIQNKYDLSNLKKAKKAIVFLVPARQMSNGGVLSIYSLCKFSREINKDAYCLLSTIPEKYTICKNNTFDNNEDVFRFEQITKHGKNIENLIIHIPEYFADKFYKKLTKKQRKYLKSRKQLQLNIMNQNILLMPEKEKLADLYTLTENITQTIAHDRYATQEICDKWEMPTHLFSVFVDFTKDYIQPFEKREKIIVLSPDKNEHRGRITQKLARELPDWEMITVQNMPFEEYIKLISKSYFVITFGEGFDGYFSQPPRLEGLSFAVYNNDFFPDASWKDLRNVYSSYDEMYENIVDDLKYFYQNKNEYQKVSQATKEKREQYYSFEKYIDNLKRFYEGKYDFVYTKTKKQSID